MIRITNLRKSFGHHMVVQDVSFAVERGETLALLGPNGSGKTTTLKCLVGLSLPDAGEIRIGGWNIAEHAQAARNLVGYLPQRVSLPENLTARETLRFYGRLRKIPPQRIEELLAQTQFSLNGCSDRPVGTFSGGMLQRLGLAIACLPDTPILILDEPMINLDPQGTLHFREYLKSLKGQGKTIVLSSHILSDVEQLADRVAILVAGKLVALKSIETLRLEMLRWSRLHIRVAGNADRWQDAARKAGAESVIADGNSLWIVSEPARRYEILRTVEAAGATILQFFTTEPSLEDIYLRYAHEQIAAGGDSSGRTAGRVPGAAG